MKLTLLEYLPVEEYTDLILPPFPSILKEDLSPECWYENEATKDGYEADFRMYVDPLPAPEEPNVAEPEAVELPVELPEPVCTQAGWECCHFPQNAIVPADYINLLQQIDQTN